MKSPKAWWEEQKAKFRQIDAYMDVFEREIELYIFIKGEAKRVHKNVDALLVNIMNYIDYAYSPDYPRNVKDPRIRDACERIRTVFKEKPTVVDVVRYMKEEHDIKTPESSGYKKQK
ncbi:MAG: hypothetical protein IIY58_05700 [Aeriscardovia sp.]|nr:hypothetical protein [Aeriscardovia sp.]